MWAKQFFILIAISKLCSIALVNIKVRNEQTIFKIQLSGVILRGIFLKRKYIITKVVIIEKYSTYTKNIDFKSTLTLIVRKLSL